MVSFAKEPTAEERYRAAHRIAGELFLSGNIPAGIFTSGMAAGMAIVAGIENAELDGVPEALRQKADQQLDWFMGKIDEAVILMRREKK